jgi:phosphohistidine phosphatase SixA
MRPGLFLRSMLAALAAGVFVTAHAGAQTASPDELVKALRQGGFVLAMRHASSPREAPAKERANADNPQLERQLDENGRRSAAAMGDAVRALKIPIALVLTSPTYRARETVKYAGFGSATAVDELGDRGKSMQGVDDSQAAWLKKKVAELPPSGNTLLVTHQPNLSKTFPDWGASVADGEMVVLRPDGRGEARLVGRIPIEAWPGLK